MEELKALYRHTFGAEPTTATTLTAAGSNRQYVRLKADHIRDSVIGCIGTSAAENQAFAYLSAHFLRLGLNVPMVIAQSQDGMRYLQTDLGSESLFDALRTGREAGGKYDDAQVALLSRTIRELPRFQVLGFEGLQEEKLLPPTHFDTRTVLFDLNYFKYCFLRTTTVDFNEVMLQDDLEHLAADLTAPCSEASGGDGFLYRDFQARNVMLKNGTTPYFIDFQSGRIGPVHYDVASFLWQASARYPSQLREKLIADYLDSLQTLRLQVQRDVFRATLDRFVLFRLLQVLGAYGLRGKFERKPHFLQSIPMALQNLRDILPTGIADPYPELRHCLEELTKAAQLVASKPNKTPGNKSPLVVRIFSFSYKKGIPEDESGNGGGYVFDCRAPHNPGRYDEYKTLTGLDAPVIEFLEHDGEILPFLDNVYRLADFHVQRYIDRGFTSLMFSFGCTGGQHRSVYSAQHLAEHIHSKFGIEVRLLHREQGIAQTWSNKQ